MLVTTQLLILLLNNVHLSVFCCFVVELLVMSAVPRWNLIGYRTCVCVYVSALIISHLLMCTRYQGTGVSNRLRSRSVVCV